MKKRDKIFIWTAIILFILAWIFLTALLDGAQAVGDAELDFNPKLRATSLSLTLTATYTIIYFGLYWLTKLFKKQLLEKL